MRFKHRFFNFLLSISIIAFSLAVKAESFDNTDWNMLLKNHVVVLDGGQATALDYQGMLNDKAKLAAYLDKLSNVTPEQLNAWPSAEQLAFLINAYNAFTVELILSEWPDLTSIKDLGTLFSSPWSKKFVPLLGELRSLDSLEHSLIRGSNRYKEPRIHFALNCASIGCPALRPEAYEGDTLARQLSEQTALFLRDRSRNRVVQTTVMLSPIFKWYREDFEKDWQGFTRLEDFLLAYHKDLELPSSVATLLKNGDAKIKFFNYDWRLNSTSSNAR